MEGGINFALFSRHASSVTLVLYNGDGPTADSVEVPCVRSGDNWHVMVEGLPDAGVRYGYKVRAARAAGTHKGVRASPTLVSMWVGTSIYVN